MRTFVLYLSFLYAGALCAQSPSDKVEAYFSFDTKCKAVDDSGNGGAGALINGISCSCGLIDSCFRFDGVDDALYLVGPFADVFSTSDFTVSFYIKPPDQTNTNGTQLVMSKQSDCSPNKAFWVRYSPKTRRISSGISETQALVTTVQAELDPGPCWQFITLTRANTRYTLYINGVKRDSKVGSARFDLTSTATFKVGEPVCPLDSWFKGDFDELRFHSKALDEVAIARYNLRADNILNSDTLIYLGNSFQVNAAARCDAQFLWSPASSVSNPFIANPVVTPTAPGNLSVTINYPGQCLANDTIHINVIDPDTLDCNKIFIPNAFTPGNSPGRNDVFGISNPFSVQDFISFEIFDRWGGRVFNANSAFETWDGNVNGSAANPGVFLYRLRYKCQGEEKVKAGNLTLLR
ncbi:MAG: gliding motility-associated C-terminal domain-containing protein [Bacteroidetes bacterium]|nr:gliding motility-associated C-terminal domain-containing protein [Bacteroidota bacterium]